MTLENSTEIVNKNNATYLPLPTAADLAEYEKVVPGMSREVLNQYINLNAQQIVNATKTVENEIKFKRFAYGIGIASVVGLFGAGSFMALAGHEAAAAVISFGGVATGIISSYYAHLTSKDSTKFLEETKLLLTSQTPAVLDVSNLPANAIEDQEVRG